MNLHASVAARRIVAAAAITCAAALGSTAALAAPGSPVALAAPGSTAALAVPGSPAGAVRTATPSCATSGLDVWLDTQGSGAAGTTYYQLEFTNLSGGSCSMYGYPGVSGVTLAGTQIGSAASRILGPPHTVTLVKGATAYALLGIVDTGVIPAAQCHPVIAGGLRAYPPGQTQFRVAPFPFSACSASGPVYLTIGPVQT